MGANYYDFEKFCELLDDSNVLKKHSVMGVVKMLQLCIIEIKSQILKDLLELDNTKIDYYLESKILQIEKQDYLKDYGVEKISHFLKRLNVTVEQLREFEYDQGLNNTIDKNLSLETYHDDFDEVRAIQESLLYYFLAYYANEIIKFLESKKIKQHKESQPTAPLEKLTKSQIIVENYGRDIAALRELREEMRAEIRSVFGNDPWPDPKKTKIEKQYNEEIERLEKNLPGYIEELYRSSNEDNYFYFDCSSKVYQEHYEERKQQYFKEILDASEEDFIYSEIEYFTSPYKNRILYIGDWFPEDYSSYVEYNDKYRITLAKKLSFLDGRLIPYNKTIEIKENVVLKDDRENDICYGTDAIVKSADRNKELKLQAIDNIEVVPEPKTEKQLTTNQIILLLQETGFFSHPKIESAPKTKQSELISKICGLNAKNLKTKIENLDKSPKDLGTNHQKDIDKIEDILNNLE